MAVEYSLETVEKLTDLSRQADLARPMRVGRYEPGTVGGEFALVIAIIDSGTIIDLASWAPKSGRMATRKGVGAMLGQGQIGRDGVGTGAVAVAARPGVLGQGDGRGTDPGGGRGGVDIR